MNQLADHEFSLGRWMPEWDVSSQHHRQIDASAADVYHVLCHVTLPSSRLSKMLMNLRCLAGGLRETAVQQPKAESLIDQLQRHGFVLLDAKSDREVNLGFVGRFWRLVPEIRAIPQQDFLAFAQAGYAKAVVTFQIVPLTSASCWLRTETRVLASDAAARWKLKLYWCVVERFSGLIRRDILAQIARLAASA